MRKTMLVTFVLILPTVVIAAILAHPRYACSEEQVGLKFSGLDSGVAVHHEREHVNSPAYLPDPGEYSIPRHLSFKSAIVAHSGYHGSPVRSETMDMGFKRLLMDIHHVGPSGVAQVMAAGFVSVVFHELGHVVAANASGAESIGVDFSVGGGSLLKGMTSYSGVNPHSMLPISMAGVAFSDIAFEHALENFRTRPSYYNRSLMLLSGMDLLKYCLLSFSGGGQDTSEDPIAVVQNTPLSKEALLSVALTKTLINAYRVYTGKDTVIPYFSVGDDYAALNMKVIF